MSELEEFVREVRDKHPEEARILEEMKKILDQFEEKQKFKYGSIETSIST